MDTLKSKRLSTTGADSFARAIPSTADLDPTRCPLATKLEIVAWRGLPPLSLTLRCRSAAAACAFHERSVHSGPLDATRTMECAKCRHPLVGDHTVKVRGVAHPPGQFAIPTSSDR